MNKEKVEIGIIGFGDMGKLYGNSFLRAGWNKVSICDLPLKYKELKETYEPQGYKVYKDGFSITRKCDFVMFSVEAASIDMVVSKYGPSMKVNSIACGQTSVKSPEINAFERYLPEDCSIVTCHSLHGPGVDPSGQPMVVINHKSTSEHFKLAESIFSALGSKRVYMSFTDHDRITADTQAVTHLAFLSMGTAWKTSKTYPWENAKYQGGIDNVKTLIALRIYDSKWHVYAGLVLLNPFALAQIQQYANSVSDLFKLMITENEVEFRRRVYAARDFVFGCLEGKDAILLEDDVLDQFSLSAIPKNERKPNSHLSLLAIVDCWAQQKNKPYEHLICQTPPFRLLLGIAEYLFRNVDLLEEAISSALFAKDIRQEDIEFYTAAKGWVTCIELRSMDAYQQRFESTAEFFKNRVPEARKISNMLIEKMADKKNK
jgi:prephenate dehydrogenase (NADP+)